MEEEDDDILGIIPAFKNVSYLRARDPSIGWCTGNCREDLLPQLGEESTVGSLEPESNTLATYLRIKPPTVDHRLYQILDDNTLQCKVPKGSHAVRSAQAEAHETKKYTFTKIFSGDASQSDLFCETVKPKLLKFLNGWNYTLLSYGASGSGKTYTIVGTANQPGLIPRALEYIFRSLPPLPEEPDIKLRPNGTIVRRIDKDFPSNDRSFRDALLNSASHFKSHAATYRKMQQRLSLEPVATVEATAKVSLGVFVSFAEIYNEHIHDLLSPHRGEKLQLGSYNGTTYIKKLTTLPISSGLQAFQILQYGLRNLSYAATGINSHSNRSHCVFAVRLAQASEEDGGCNVSCFSFYDLAGCERLKRTMNVGERLKESNNINTSLLVLRRCVSAVRELQRQKDHRLVPYRESKLTLLMKCALAGLEDVSMIVNVNAAGDSLEETVNVLEFSAVAKDIVIEQPQNKELLQRDDSKPVSEAEEMGRLSERVMELLTEREQLREQLVQREEQVRAQLINSYKETMKEQDEFYGKEIQKLETEHEWTMGRLRRKYNKQKKNNPAVKKLRLASKAELEETLANVKGEVQEAVRTLELIAKRYRELEKNITSEKRETMDLNFELSYYSQALEAKEGGGETETVTQNGQCKNE